MRVALITTLQHNVGDDFVREGIKYLIKKSASTDDVRFASIHKHSPITARYGFEKYRRFQKYEKLDRLLPLKLTRDRILESDMVIQCGAPIYWCHDEVNAHCCDNEWFTPLVERRLVKIEKARFLNIAGGSCQKYRSNGTEVCERCKIYMRELYDASSLTTLRDDLAQNMLMNAGADAPVIPCPSLFAVDEHHIKPETGDYVVLNFMDIAGHYSFQSIDATAWRRTFQRFYERIKNTTRLVFVCHDAQELEFAHSFDPDVETFHSDNYVDYLHCYARARFGIVNRLHAAYALAGLGKPSLVIGNDSRTLMAKQIGLKYLYVDDVTVDMLDYHFDRLEKNIGYHADAHVFKQKALADYLDALASI